MGRYSTKDECDTCRNKRNDGRLHLQQRQVADDDLSACIRLVELPNIRCCTQACREIHLEVPFEIENNGNDHDEFIHAGQFLPMLRMGSVR